MCRIFVSNSQRHRQVRLKQVWKYHKPPNIIAAIKVNPGNRSRFLANSFRVIIEC